MSTADVYDCIVIGAGVQGSFTAYELAKRGKRTVLLEQVRPGRNSGLLLGLVSPGEQKNTPITAAI